MRYKARAPIGIGCVFQNPSQVFPSRALGGGSVPVLSLSSTLHGDLNPKTMPQVESLPAISVFFSNTYFALLPP